MASFITGNMLWRKKRMRTNLRPLSIERQSQKPQIKNISHSDCFTKYLIKWVQFWLLISTTNLICMLLFPKMAPLHWDACVPVNFGKELRSQASSQTRDSIRSSQKWPTWSWVFMATLYSWVRTTWEHRRAYNQSLMSTVSTETCCRNAKTKTSRSNMFLWPREKICSLLPRMHFNIIYLLNKTRMHLNKVLKRAEITGANTRDRKSVV